MYPPITTAPSTYNFLIPSTLQSFLKLDVLRSKLKISREVILEENSPQYRALKWIIEEDKFNFMIESSNLAQRYALVVFFYSRSGYT